MKAIPTKNVSGNVDPVADAGPQDGWVSPEVLASQSGETVDFSKDVPTHEDLNDA